MDEIVKVYGPYKRSDGRLHVVLVDNKGKRKTVSYPKWLVEQEIGEELGPNETVHHIDGDPLNNELSNLKIIDRRDHVIKDVKRAYNIETNCVWCGSFVIRSIRSLETAAREGRAGPFCGAQCVAEYTAAVRAGEVEPFPPTVVPEKRYFKIRND